MNYICFKCGEEVKIDPKRKKEQIKCDHCGHKVIMKIRKPTQYIAL
jgi:DNA-directed RNA polymerase subunit RPC12/RpoP